MVINFIQFFTEAEEEEEGEKVIFSRMAAKYETPYEINKQTRLIK